MKRWWELYCVLSLSKIAGRLVQGRLIARGLIPCCQNSCLELRRLTAIIFLVGFLSGFISQAFCFDAPVAFVGDFGCAPEGLPGWNSTPARRAAPAFGISGYMRSDSPEEWVLSAAGEWGNPHYRVAFLYSYYALDSLFRESGASIEASFSRWFLVAGLGFGGITQWVPGDAAWLRYRLKFGISAQARGFTLASWWQGFTDEWREYPRAGVFWDASQSFRAYVATDMQAVFVGTSLRFAWGSIETSYSFPGFSLAFGISFAFSGYGIGAKYGTGGALGPWEGLWVSKSLKKGT